MKTKIILTSTLLALACGQADKTRLTSASNGNASLSSTINGNNQFAIDIYNVIAKDQKNENVFLAPYSISSALAMTYAGARNNTAKEMAEVLRFSGSQIETHGSFKKLNGQIISSKDTDGYELKTANRLWGQIDFPFKSDFLNTTLNFYDAELQTLNFKDDVEGSRQTINKWVEDKTNNRIQNLIPQGSLTEDARLVLTNAIYFLGQWSKQFEAHGTTKASFSTMNGEKVTVDMMHQTEHLKYAEDSDLGVDALELPYLAKGQKSASMVVLLPKDTAAMSKLESGLSPEKISQLFSKMESRHIALAMPKFKTVGAFSLGETLKSLGMIDAFSDTKADFRNMATLNPDENLYISKVLHKTFLQVDEGGTEAAGATAVVIDILATSIDPMPILPITLDHPFMLMIKDNTTNSILFLGRIADPTR